MMNIYGVDHSDSNIRGPLVSLDILYEEMPETQGCENCANANREDAIWCCRTHNPSMYYIEFLLAWEGVQRWSKPNRVSLVLEAARNYLSNRRDKGCIFWEQECKIYKQRPFACFLGDTVVLTAKGPKLIKDVIAGDQVMTHKGRYKKVLHSISKLHKSNLRKITTKSDLGVVCTPDHRFYSVSAKDKRGKFGCKLHWRGAEFLYEKRTNQEGYYNCFPKIDFGLGLFSIKVSDFVSCIPYEDGRVLSITHSNTPEGRTPSPIPEYFEVNKDFLWMLGLYLAEGSCSNSSASFCLHKNEQKTFGRRLAKYFGSLNISWSEYFGKRNTYTFHVNSSIFMKFIKKICGSLCYNKMIHPSLFNLSSGQLMEIFYGWNDGDGTSRPANGCKWRVTTTSRLLLYQMYFVLMSNGFHPFLFSEQRPNRDHASYYLCVYHPDFKTKPGQGTCYKSEGDLTFYPVKHNDEINNEGEVCVFDLQVEDDESFVTSAGVSHNCRMYALIPSESWNERANSLKRIYGDDFEPRPQCDLVTTKDGEPITKEHEDKWFNHIKKCELRIGMPLDAVAAHDAPVGSYRTFHDHLLLELFNDEFLHMLSEVRLKHDPQPDEIDTFIELLASTLQKKGVLE